jgi:hypothetical protein
VRISKVAIAVSVALVRLNEREGEPSPVNDSPRPVTRNVVRPKRASLGPWVCAVWSVHA